jgi:hypothetical protein
MKMNKNWLIVGLVTGAAALALTTGAVFAQTATPSPTATPGASSTAIPATSFAARLAAILGLDPAKVQSAIQQVRQQQQTDAVKARLDALVKAGKITQAQEDSYLSWLATKPAGVPPAGLGNLGRFGGFGGGEDEGHGRGRGHGPKGPPSLTTPAPTATPGVSGTSA